MSVFDQANSLINNGMIESYFGTVDSYWKDNELWTLNPLRNDKTVGSFSISEGGFYKDFASNDQGDFIGLIANKYGISDKESAEKIIIDAGDIVDIDKKYRPKSAKKKVDKPKSKIIGRLSSSDKDGLLSYAKSSFYLKDDYELSNIFPYKNIDNETLFYIARYEKIDQDGKKKKKIIPFYKSIDNKWIGKRPDDILPLPLFNLQHLKNSDLPVLVVSGEKCAGVKIDGYDVVSWQGGDGRIKETDWSTLNNKDVILWADNDDSGKKAIIDIKNNYLQNAIILDLSNIGKPAKWDIEDAFNDGINIIEFIDNHKPIEKPIEVVEAIMPEIINDDNIERAEQIDLDPEYVYEFFLKEIYNDTGLLKLDGVYWKYF